VILSVYARLGPLLPDLNVPVVRCADAREAGRAPPTASQGIPSVLALEVETDWTAAVAPRILAGKGGSPKLGWNYRGAQVR
jgi:hypothetical protein